MKYITTLTIAGSDSCGGAGIQADLKTMSALGCYATSVITAITAQNTMGVFAVRSVSPEMVEAQLRAVMSDMLPDAIKIGMVNDVETIRVIADTMREYDVEHIVIDPVMVSTSGSRLMERTAVATFREKLLPLAELLTPNIHETEVLSGVSIETEADIDRAAELIMTMGCKALLVKGGHLEGEKKTDRLYLQNGSRELFEGKTIATRNTHGTGCTLSSAIAAYLARGEQLNDAVGRAKAYVGEALSAGADMEMGRGFGPVNHFFQPEKLIRR